MPSWRPLAILFTLLAAVPLAAASCDPTEDTFAVQLLNNENSKVTVRQCDTRCDQFHEVDVISPGATVRVNTSSSHVDNWWAIEDAGGRRTGCLDLLFDEKKANVVLKTSDQVPCPK